jgi:hypothetical protein
VRRGRWIAAAFALLLPFVLTETLATILAWLASGVRGLALVAKRFGLAFRYAVKRAQGWCRVRGAWVKQRQPNQRRARS